MLVVNVKLEVVSFGLVFFGYLSNWKWFVFVVLFIIMMVSDFIFIVFGLIFGVGLRILSCVFCWYICFLVILIEVLINEIGVMYFVNLWWLWKKVVKFL